MFGAPPDAESVAQPAAVASIRRHVFASLGIAPDVTPAELAGVRREIDWKWDRVLAGLDGTARALALQQLAAVLVAAQGGFDGARRLDVIAALRCGPWLADYRQAFDANLLADAIERTAPGAPVRMRLGWVLLG